MRLSLRHISVTSVAVATTTALALTTTPAAAAPAPHGDGRWAASWGVSHKYPGAPAGWPPNWSSGGFADESVRQVLRVSSAGSQVRLRVSNRYGTQPLVVTGATVARSGEGPAVRPGTVRTLRFQGGRGLTVPTGRDAVSDPLALPVRPLEKLTVTLHFAAGGTGPVSYHPEGLTTSYRAAGDRTRDTSGQPFAGEGSYAYYVISGVDVAGPRTAGTVVAFGDSITDGAGSTPGADNRYPDQLAERLTAARSRLSVVNAGMSGNTLLSDSPCFGQKGIERFRHDVLDQPGVRTAVVLIGINDIGAGGGPDFGCGLAPLVTARDVINGHRTLIRLAKARGVKIVGATLTPFKGIEYEGYYSEAKNAVRKEVNHWIRTSGAYDAVADLDVALRDPADPDRLLPAYDSGDRIHPSDAGMDAMARTVLPRVTGADD
ncbi:SGNH/GDSL hydrolase family protein [Streptomyces qinzhouensis]|uniref:SGNH/GDSL hydrolase family protein n=1 Tax=Streptomyces qinzhouensis TaxID=2599401 RepID=A0A5B8J7R5_9ACTN|nr:SGNH/GDSL hydrolase family protein [Streptomyces qinzhouensis]QDY77276.1 SGNH/GDSL hydrolase family protein [Streptomyces qinzhouensis]